MPKDHLSSQDQDDNERQRRVFFPLKLFAKRKSTFFFLPANHMVYRLLSTSNLPPHTACQMRAARDIASATRVNVFILLSFCFRSSLSLKHAFLLGCGSC